MQILITNDDGINANGLDALQQEVRKIGKVTIVAPDGERSSISHGITLGRPLWYHRVARRNKLYGYAVSGTPADCVKIAIGVILPRKPDLVISGINHGSNDGCSVFYSGTVAGAREGAMMGIPSMSVSLASFTSSNFTASAKIAARIAKLILKKRLPSGTYLNVNVPDLPPSKIKNVLITRQGREPIHGKFLKRQDPLSRDYYWLTAEAPVVAEDLNNDTYALSKGYVTVTPVHCDLTDTSILAELKTWSW